MKVFFVVRSIISRQSTHFMFRFFDHRKEANYWVIVICVFKYGLIITSYPMGLSGVRNQDN